jgi:hypothetical protein
MYFQTKALHSVSHTQTNDLKRVGIGTRRDISSCTRNQQQNERVMLSHETGYCLFCEVGQGENQRFADENAQEMENKTNASKKCMFNVFGTHWGLHVVTLLGAQRQRFDSNWFVQNRLKPFVNPFFREGRKSEKTSVVLDVDTAKHRTSKPLRVF